jgi:hypothetical protein
MRTCTVCQHQGRRKIDAAIVFGKSERSIAKQFRVTSAAIHRHKIHVAESLERASEKREVSIGESILDRLENLYQRGVSNLDKAEKTKSHYAICSYLRELRGILAGLYQIGVAVAPKETIKLLPVDYIAAIRRALGVGRLEPITEKSPALLSAGNGHNANGAMDADFGEALPTLPQD